MLRAAYADAGVAPGTVGYVEAHGTGTRAGDPVELGALGAVLGPGARRERALPGRLGEDQHRPHRGRRGDGRPDQVRAGARSTARSRRACTATSRTRRSRGTSCRSTIPQRRERRGRAVGSHPRLAGVSAFGIAGTNAHVVLEEAPPRLRRAPSVDGVDRPRCSCCRRRRRRALRGAGRRSTPTSLADGARRRSATCARPRPDTAPRSSTVRCSWPTTAADLVGALRRFAAGDAAGRRRASAAQRPARRTAMAFVFPGQGAQWVGMARELLAARAGVPRRDRTLRRRPARRARLDRPSSCRPIPTRRATPGRDRRDPADAARGRDRTRRAVASRGASSRDAVVGHSMGEVGAAHVAGALSLEEAMRIICRRSALMQRTSGAGAMALVELSIDETTRAHRAARRIALCVAVSNSPRSTVVSGDPDAVADAARRAASATGSSAAWSRSTSHRTARRWIRSCPSSWRRCATCRPRADDHDALLHRRRGRAAGRRRGTPLLGPQPAPAGAVRADRRAHAGRRHRRLRRGRPASDAARQPRPRRRHDGRASPSTLGSLRRGEPERGVAAGRARRAVGGGPSRRLAAHLPRRTRTPGAAAALPVAARAALVRRRAPAAARRCVARRRSALDETAKRWLHVPALGARRRCRTPSDTPRRTGCSSATDADLAARCGCSLERARRHRPRASPSATRRPAGSATRRRARRRCRCISCPRPPPRPSTRSPAVQALQADGRAGVGRRHRACGGRRGAHT